MPSIEFGKRITSAVGKNGTNLLSDVRTIKYLINNVPEEQGGAGPLAENSDLPQLISAITSFQTFQFNGGDGRVDPGGKTLRLLHNFDPTPSGPVFVPLRVTGKKGGPFGTGKKGENRGQFFPVPLVPGLAIPSSKAAKKGTGG